MLVMVAGNSRVFGLWVVTPTSMEPDHLSTNLSSRIWMLNIGRWMLNYRMLKDEMLLSSRFETRCFIIIDIIVTVEGQLLEK